MDSRLLRRRSATAVGTYTSVALGVLGTVVAARVLGKFEFGRLAVVLAAVSFFQVALDLTLEEAVVKFGFRYRAQQAWGKLRRLYRVGVTAKAVGGLLGAALLVVLAPFASDIFGARDLQTPLLVGALLPLVQSPEAVAGTALLLHGRYDLRAWFLALSMALRLCAFVIGTQYGVTETMVALVVAQVVATSAICTGAFVALRHFPHAPAEPLAEDRGDIVRFAAQSSVASGVVALRPTLSPLLLGIVSSPTQVGFFRIAQAPAQGLNAAVAPARIVLLTEQTRDWEAGERERIFSGLRHYMFAATALMVVAVPVFWFLMPELVPLVFGNDYDAHDPITAARIVLFAGALQLVLAWTKSFPVSIGRPNLRIVAHGIETLALIPLVLVLGARYDAPGAAGAFLISSVVFALVWAVLWMRVRADTPRLVEAPAR
jgi:O-antigen/teichoic acid export membrane protein